MDTKERELLDVVARTAGRVKLFPLPEVTLFPSHGLPLHVFEPRYRALARDVLDSDGVIGIPQIVPGQGQASHPRLFPIIGVGVIAEHQALPDGKFNLVVRGVARARLLRELPTEHLYREAAVEILPDDDSGVSDKDSSALAACLLELGRRLSPDTQVALGQLAALQRTPGRLADLSAAALLTPPIHQQVLNELNVKRRLTLVTDHVAELLLATKPERGTYLN